MTAEQTTAAPLEQDAVYARIFESGRQACAEDNHRRMRRAWRREAREDLIRSNRLAYRNGLRTGSLRALVALAGLGVVALVLRGRGS